MRGHGIITLALIVGLGLPALAMGESMVDDSLRALFEGSMRAPDFPEGLTWFNTETPLSIQNLRGKLVLLDFWTYCCINCMHILPELSALEKKFHHDLVVIGVHSAKFPNERERKSLRNAILRYGISHPVVSDPEYAVWSAYTVRAWPTLVLISPEGRIIGMHSGEGAPSVFESVIEKAVDYYSAQGRLKRTPLSGKCEKEDELEKSISFPGKIIADSASGRIILADSGHHRILVLDSLGRILDILGTGKPGHADGTFEQAEFRNPQGMVLDGDRVIIADTENHLIRIANLTARRVETMFGTGFQAAWGRPVVMGPEQPLNSPWDVFLHRNRLYIAMAGAHQVWQADPHRRSIRVHAGSGREALEDGIGSEAALAQPSGITGDGTWLYIADSETSAIRTIDPDEPATVTTLVGQDLFEFGDVDGIGPQVRLQHPLGVLWHRGVLYVADTYNHRIKALDPIRRSITTLAGTGTAGYFNGPANQAEFFEPGGLAALGDTLFIADTNNHAIRVIDLRTRIVGTLDVLDSSMEQQPEVPRGVQP